MQYVSQSCAESKQMSALRSLKLCNILPTANRKKPVQGSPSPKRSRSAPILRADLFLMQTLINPQIDSISLQYPGGHRREIKIISGFAGAVIALLVTQPEEILFRTAFGSPHRKPLCYYNMSGNHGKSNLNGQKTDIL